MSDFQKEIQERNASQRLNILKGFKETESFFSKGKAEEAKETLEKAKAETSEENNNIEKSEDGEEENISTEEQV